MGGPLIVPGGLVRLDPEAAKGAAAAGAPLDAARFDELKAEALHYAELYSSDHWTDFNEHDPGVTILEQLCFALTDLGYRAASPVPDLLADPDGRLGTAAGSLRSPARIYSSEPVTADDYRRLLIDRVPGLANAWLEPRGPAPGEAPSGLYDIALLPAERLPGLWDGHGRDPKIAERAARVFVRHRALCEDIGSLTVLRPVRTVVRASVSIERDARPEEVMAQILFGLGLYFAPEPRRETLAAQLERGRALSDIFEGPLPANGFIPPGGLGPQRREARSDEIETLILSVPGVRAVNGFFLWVQGARTAPERSFAIPAERYFSLDAGLEAGTQPIQLSAGSEAREPSLTEVRRRLERLWVAHRRKHRIAAECHRLLPPPTGRYRSQATHTPTAPLFPPLYGLGRGAGEEGGRQLAGFLALFDRIMADYLDRLAALPALLSGGAVEAKTFARPLAEAMPALAALLIDSGPDAHAIYGRSAFPPDQQSRLLDLLLALYGEAPGETIPQPASRTAEAALRHEVAVKQALLRSVASVGRGRGRGLDYRARRWRRMVSGVEQRCRILLGAEDVADRRQRPRLAAIEHPLLRPRGTGAPEPEGADYSMRLTTVVHLPGTDGDDYDYRALVEAAVRANTPAHIHLAVHFVGRDDWVRFKRIHRLWRQALRHGYDEGVDWLSAEIGRRFQAWGGRRA